MEDITRRLALRLAGMSLLALVPATAALAKDGGDDNGGEGGGRGRGGDDSSDDSDGGRGRGRGRGRGSDNDDDDDDDDSNDDSNDDSRSGDRTNFRASSSFDDDTPGHTRRGRGTDDGPLHDLNDDKGFHAPGHS
jgi:hypothetical protein